MRTNWKQIAQGGIKSEYAGYYVTLNPKGMVHMNRVTYHRLGAPDAFQLFFDEANNRIGLKPSAKAAKDAYVAGHSGRNGGRSVYIQRLLNECSIDLPATVRFYDAEIDQDGFLVLDLRTARVPPSVIGHRKRLDRKVKLPAPGGPHNGSNP